MREIPTHHRYALPAPEIPPRRGALSVSEWSWTTPSWDMRPNPLSGSTTTPVTARTCVLTVCADLVWSRSIGARHKITPLAGARASVRHASPAIRCQRCHESQPCADALSAHHPLRNAGSNCPLIERYVLSQQSVTGCNSSGGSHLRDTGKAPHGLFESLKSEEAQNRGAESTSPAKRPRFAHLRQAEPFMLPVALTSFPCSSKIGSLLLPC